MGWFDVKSETVTTKSGRKKHNTKSAVRKRRWSTRKKWLKRLGALALVGVAAKTLHARGKPSRNEIGMSKHLEQANENTDHDDVPLKFPREEVFPNLDSKDSSANSSKTRNEIGMSKHLEQANENTDGVPANTLQSIHTIAVGDSHDDVPLDENEFPREEVFPNLDSKDSSANSSKPRKLFYKRAQQMANAVGAVGLYYAINRAKARHYEHDNFPRLKHDALMRTLQLKRGDPYPGHWLLN
jgi:hypothetical protein